MKDENKTAKKIEMGSILFYALTQILLLLMILVTAFVLYEYQDGKRQGDYDKNYVKKEATVFDVKRSKNEPENVLLVMDESVTEDRGQATKIAILQHDFKTKEINMVSFIKETKVAINGETHSLTNLYQTGGIELLSQALMENFQVKLTHYLVVTPYTFPKILAQILPKKFEFDNQTRTAEQMYQKLTDSNLSEVAQLNQDFIFTEALLQQAFTVKNVTHLPGAVGSLLGYGDTNIPLSMLTSHLRGVMITDKMKLNTLIVPLEVGKNEGVQTTLTTNFDQALNTREILRIFE